MKLALLLPVTPGAVAAIIVIACILAAIYAANLGGNTSHGRAARKANALVAGVIVAFLFVAGCLAVFGLPTQ